MYYIKLYTFRYNNEEYRSLLRDAYDRTSNINFSMYWFMNLLQIAIKQYSPCLFNLLLQKLIIIPQSGDGVNQP